MLLTLKIIVVKNRDSESRTLGRTCGFTRTAQRLKGPGDLVNTSMVLLTKVHLQVVYASLHLLDVRLTHKTSLGLSGCYLIFVITLYILFSVCVCVCVCVCVRACVSEDTGLQCYIFIIFSLVFFSVWDIQPVIKLVLLSMAI